MFNMEKVGRNIAELRRKCDMTQMELADKMGISFQAVSNWERGNSMPDISKLPELAEVFGVTIDHLLGECSEIVESAVKGDIKTYLENNEITAEEIQKVAPILKPKQMDDIVESVILERKEKANLREIEDLLPFVGREVVNKLALQMANNGEYEELDCILPFAGEDVIDQIAHKMIDEGKSIEDIVPFVSKDIIIEHAENLYQKFGLRAIEGLMPFIPEDLRNRIAEMEYAKHGLRHFESIAPFLNRKYLNDLAQKAIHLEGIKAISNIAPFLDRNMLAEYVKEKFL